MDTSRYMLVLSAIFRGCQMCRLWHPDGSTSLGWHTFNSQHCEHDVFTWLMMVSILVDIELSAFFFPELHFMSWKGPLSCPCLSTCSGSIHDRYSLSTYSPGRVHFVQLMYPSRMSGDPWFVHCSLTCETNPPLTAGSITAKCLRSVCAGVCVCVMQAVQCCLCGYITVCLCENFVWILTWNALPYWFHPSPIHTYSCRIGWVITTSLMQNTWSKNMRSINWVMVFSWVRERSSTKSLPRSS